MSNLTPDDLVELRQAAEKLEGRSFAMTIAQKVGMPVEAILRMLPAAAQNGIGVAVNTALDRCLRVALALGKGSSGSARSNRTHMLTTAVTGAVGGFFGLPGLVVELPVTTTVMLHSIAEIARSQGEDLTEPDAALACLEVFALGPEGRGAAVHGAVHGAVQAAVHGEALESAYYATRAALAQVTRDAAAYVAQKGLAKESAPALVSFIGKIAARFGLEVSEKAAAQLVPVAGALGGMTLNVLFTQHFQTIAEGHFTMRRLERMYGAEAVRREYESARLEAAQGSR